MLLTKTVEIKLRKDNIVYYHNKGYKGNLTDVITINTLDLPKYSGVKVKYKCDYPGCEEVVEISYSDYYKKRHREYSEAGDFCIKHAKIARNEWLQNNNPDKLSNEKQQRVNSIINTCTKKYGVKNPMQVEDIKEKFKQSMVVKYGFENPMQVQEFKNNFMKSMVDLHPDLEEHWSENGGIYYKIHGIPCSKNQKYICDLYRGKLNEYVSGFYLDILLDDKIYFEYNGQGHDLSVKMKHMTAEEFKLKEIQRYNILKQKGYKQITLTSVHHKILPSDEVLLSLKEVAIQYLSIKNNHWIDFNYDNNIIRIKGKEIPYDFSKPINIEYLN